MSDPSLVAVLESGKLLVRGVNWLGDAVMTTPALQRLRERFPNARITLLTPEHLAGLWERHPSLDAIIPFNRAESPWSVSRRLRLHGFAVALILPNSPRSALEACLAGIPHRIGYVGAWRNWFLTRALEYPPGRMRLRRRGVREVKTLIAERKNLQHWTQSPHQHQSHDYLHLAAALGANPGFSTPKLEVSEDEVKGAIAMVDRLLQARAPGSDGKAKILLGINPSAAYGPAKRWPVERFASTASAITQRVPTCVWLIFGGMGDWDLGEQLARLGGGRMLNLAGATSLRQLMALLKVCRVLLTNDSGPMHVAAALGTSVVALFGSTSPELTAPGRPGDSHHRLLSIGALCSPCFRRTCPIDFRCMTGIPAESAVAAILESLNM